MVPMPVYIICSLMAFLRRSSDVIARRLPFRRPWHRQFARNDINYLLCWLIGRDHHTFGCGLAIDQLQSRIWAPLSEEPLPCSENKRVNQQHILIDKLILHEGLDQFSATQDHQVFFLLSFECCNCFWHVALEKGRVHPGKRLLQCP